MRTRSREEEKEACGCTKDVGGTGTTGQLDEELG